MSPNWRKIDVLYRCRRSFIRRSARLAQMSLRAIAEPPARIAHAFTNMHQDQPEKPVIGTTKAVMCSIKRSFLTDLTLWPRLSASYWSWSRINALIISKKSQRSTTRTSNNYHASRITHQEPYDHPNH